MSEPLQLLIDVGVFFDKQVSSRNIRFGLIIVVVRDKKLDGGSRKKVSELGGELRGQNFVGCQNERGALRLLDDFRHREGLAGAGRAQQRLIPQTVAQTFDQTADRLRLIAFRRERGFDRERHKLLVYGSSPKVGVRCRHQPTPLQSDYLSSADSLL